jgi:hypothetical protein
MAISRQDALAKAQGLPPAARCPDALHAGHASSDWTCCYEQGRQSIVHLPEPAADTRVLVLVSQLGTLTVYQRKMDGLWGPLNAIMGSVNWNFLISVADVITVLEPKTVAYRMEECP